MLVVVVAVMLASIFSILLNLSTRVLVLVVVAVVLADVIYKSDRGLVRMSVAGANFSNTYQPHQQPPRLQREGACGDGGGGDACAHRRQVLFIVMSTIFETEQCNVLTSLNGIGGCSTRDSIGSSAVRSGYRSREHCKGAENESSELSELHCERAGVQNDVRSDVLAVYQ